MGWTKRNLVKKAYSSIGLSSVDFDLPAEQLLDGLLSLEAMMASWDSAGLRLGYPIVAEPVEGDLDQQAGVPDYAYRAIYMKLAIELAANIGREVSSRFAAMAKEAYDRLVAVQAAPIPMRYPSTMPSGAGNKPWAGTLRPYLVDEDDDNIDAGEDSELDFK